LTLVFSVHKYCRKLRKTKDGCFKKQQQDNTRLVEVVQGQAGQFIVEKKHYIILHSRVHNMDAVTIIDYFALLQTTITKHKK